MLNQTQFLELFHQRTGVSAGFALMLVHISRKDSSQLQRGALAFWPCSDFHPVWVRGPGGRTLRDNIKRPRELQLWKELWSCILSEFPLIPVFLFPCSSLLAANWLFFRSVSVHSFPQRFLFFFFYLPHPPFRTSPPPPPVSHLVFLIFPLSSFIPASLFLSTSFSMLLISGKKQTKTTGRRKLHFFCEGNFISSVSPELFILCLFSPGRSDSIFTSWLNYEEKWVSLMLVHWESKRALFWHAFPPK